MLYFCIYIYVCIKFCLTYSCIFSVSFDRKYINFIYLPIAVKMSQLKVDATNNTFQFDAKSHQLFLWEFSFCLKMLERGGSLFVKS